jgi:nitrate/nitrite transporter NarK
MTRRTITGNGKWQTLAFTLLCQATQAVSLAGLPLLLPLIRQDLGLSFSQAGSLASASLLVYALMQIPAGYLADRYSPRRLVSIGALGMMSLSMLLALTGQFWHLLAIQFFWGFFSSFIFTPSMSIYISWFSSQRRNTATALPLIGPSLGILAVNFLFPLIANHYDNWRPPFIIYGGAGIIFALALLVFGRDAQSVRMPARFRPDLIKELFRHQQVWICYILQFVRFGIVQGLMFWLPSLLVDEKGFSLQLAGIVIALQAVILAPSNILGGYFSDRFKKPIEIIGVSMVMLGITCGLMVLLNSTGLVIAVILINAIFLQMYFGPLFTLAVEKLGPEKTGISNGVSNMFAIIGGLFSAYLMGFLRDATSSFEWGFYAICILCAVGLVSVVILERMRRADSPSRT